MYSENTATMENDDIIVIVYRKNDLRTEKECIDIAIDLMYQWS